MKRKLFCIFLVLVGAAVIAGTILLSLGRPEEADASAVYALIILSVITIIAAAASMSEPYIFEMTERERTLLWVYRAVNIVSILVCFAFIVIMFFLTGYYSDFVLPNAVLLIFPAAASMIVAALNLRVRPPIVRRNIIKVAVTLLISAGLIFVYASCMPKYAIEDGIKILHTDEEFAQKDVYYPAFFAPGEPNGYIYRVVDYSYDELIGSNPFYRELFEYYCDSYGYDANGLHDVKGYIIFNPATGAFAYVRTKEQDLTFSPGDWPEFNWNFMQDRDKQHATVLNLYFREWYPAMNMYADDVNPMLTVSSNEWDSKIVDVMYPHNFPEDEARAFLRSIGEEELKTKLLKQLNDLDQVVVFDKKEDGTLGLTIKGTKGKTVEVYFFGIDIATYQDGEIVLKL